MPNPHTGIGNKIKSFQKRHFRLKMSASDKLHCEIRVCYLIYVFFGVYVLLLHDDHHMNVGVHIRPKSIPCTVYN